MGCPHLSDISEQDFKMPDHASLVLNDECSQCFQMPESEGGLYICGKCFNGGCKLHAMNHSKITSHGVSIHLRKTAVPNENGSKDSRPKKVTKLAIGGENGFPLPEAIQYETSTQVACMRCPETPEFSDDRFISFINAIIDHKSLTKQTTVEAWEEQRIPCTHTQNLKQEDVPNLSTKSLAHCKSCDLRDNLWLCMTCGSLGCGRSVYGGGGGNNHAVEHNANTGHPLVCKLGTISAEGSADIFCYGCNEMRVDENLVSHLQHFGIATNEMQRTSKTMAEMELEQNLNHEWSKVIENDETMKLLYGPGYTGLKNLGNSCYLASTVQVVLSLAPFRHRYFTLGQQHLKDCRSWRPWDCYQCQMAKLASGLLSGQYSNSPPESSDELEPQPGVPPSMFKRLISASHPEFKTFHQQDAMQFFQFFLEEIRKQERSNTCLDPTSAFSFVMEQRLQCSGCRKVKYTNVNTSDISLEIPAEQSEHPVPLSRCLEIFKGAHSVDFNCPSCQSKRTAEISHRMVTFPDVLVAHMQRFNYSDWVPKKMQTRISVPMTELNLEALRGHGQLPDEISLPDSESSFTPSEELLHQLLNMGFSSNACVRALKAVNNSDADAAAEWLFSHLDDPDINDPIVANNASSSSGQSFDADAVAMLSSMGFDEERCKKALTETSGDVQRACDWLMSHVEETEETAETARGSQGPAVYDLTGMITHLGPSINCGHYVAHVYKADDGRWVCFNDNRVSDSVTPPTEMAYIYCFQRRVKSRFQK